MAEASYESTYQPAAEDSGVRPTRPLRLSEVPRWDQETGVVIVGLGGAGAAAAIEACEAGAEVLILERASEGGGSTAQSGGIIYFGGGTPVQQACGFEDDPGEMLKYLLMASGPNPDAEKCKLYVEQSLEHFAWFEGQGIEFKRSYYPKKTTEPVTDDCLLYSGNENVWPFDRTAKAAPRGHKPQVEGSAGRAIMETLIARVKALGARIQENARAQTLIVDDSGAVVGVHYKQLGEPRYARATKGVILCAGGFIMNRELVARHVPKLLNVNIQIGNPGDDGAGILMGLGVGAGTLCMGEGFVSVPFYPPSKLVSGIIVNAQGQRFINEDVPRAHWRVRAPTERWRGLPDPGQRVLRAAHRRHADQGGRGERRGARASARAPRGLPHPHGRLLQPFRGARRRSAVPQGNELPEAAGQRPLRGARSLGGQGHHSWLHDGWPRYAADRGGADR